MFHQELCFYQGTNHKGDEKTKSFIWTTKCQESWDQIKQKYMEAPILIPPNWQLEFHVHTYASLLAIGVMLAHNPTGKYH
jgi:hypothetical protein